MTYNLGDLPRDEREKVNVDLAASGVAYKERLNLPVIAEQVDHYNPNIYVNIFDNA